MLHHPSGDQKPLAVLIISDLPATDADVAAHGTAAAARAAMLDDIVHEVVGLNAVVVNFASPEQERLGARAVNNTAGEGVLVVPVGANEYGHALYDITATFVPDGYVYGSVARVALASSAVAKVALDCATADDAATAGHVDVIRAQVAASLAETVASVAGGHARALAEAVTCATAECALGNLVADAVLQAAPAADIAFVNHGIIAAPLVYPGPGLGGAINVTRADIVRTVPQIHEVVRLDGVPGKDILAALTLAVGVGENKSEFLQVGKTLRLAWHKEDGVAVVESVSIWQAGGSAAVLGAAAASSNAEPASNSSAGVGAGAGAGAGAGGLGQRLRLWGWGCMWGTSVGSSFAAVLSFAPTTSRMSVA